MAGVGKVNCPFHCHRRSRAAKRMQQKKPRRQKAPWLFIFRPTSDSRYLAFASSMTSIGGFAPVGSSSPQAAARFINAVQQPVFAPQQVIMLVCGGAHHTATPCWRAASPARSSLGIAPAARGAKQLVRIGFQALSIHPLHLLFGCFRY